MPGTDGGVTWGQVVLATNVAETSITIDDVGERSLQAEGSRFGAWG